MSFDAFPHDQWPDVVAALSASIPWPEALAAHDLRWHAAEHAIYRRPLPSERDLAERWNWSRPKVNRTIRAERWRDPSREWTWREPTVSQERAKREPTVSQAGQEQAQETYTSEPTVSHPRANGEPTVSLTRDLFSPAPAPAPDTAENAPAPAVAFTPNPDQSHDDQPPRSPSPESRPDARGPPDGSGGHAERGGEAPPTRQPLAGDPRPESDQGRAGPAVKWRAKLPAEMVGAVLRCIEAVKQKPVNPERAGTDAKQLLALWRALGSPSAADFERDFVAVATWARESAHPLAARAIRAEGWSDGFDRSRSVDTLTRHAQWSDRLDAARSCAEPPAAKPTPAPADLMDNYRRLVGILCQRDDRRLIEGDDERHTLTLRYAVKLCGGRDAFRADPSAFLDRWPEVWAGAEAEVAAKLAAMGQQ